MTKARDRLAGGGDFAGDMLVDMVLNGLSGDEHSVHDGSFTGGSMGFHNVPVEPQEWRTAVTVGIHAPGDCPKSVSGQERSELALGVLHELSLEPLEHATSETLASLENDVADEAIANDDIDAIAKEVMAFDIADEVNGSLLAEFIGFEGQFIAFDGLGADAQDADTGLSTTEDLPGVDMAHDGVLEEMHRFTVNVRPGIEQNKVVFRCRDDRGDAGSFDARKGSQLESGRGDNTAGVARRNDGLSVAGLNEIDGTSDRAVLLAAQGGDRTILHGEDLAGMNDVDPGVVPTDLGKGGFDLSAVAHQVEGSDTTIPLEGELEAIDDHGASEITSHDIHSDLHKSKKRRGTQVTSALGAGGLCGDLDGDDLTSLVIAASGADPVGNIRGGALRAGA